MNEKQIDQFEKTFAQIISTYEEFSNLSKKSPDSPINKFKLSFVNSIIVEANEILGKINIPFKNFTEFNEDDLPTNSDIIFIFSQYLNSFQKIITDNSEFGKWKIGGKNSDKSVFKSYVGK